MSYRNKGIVKLNSKQFSKINWTSHYLIISISINHLTYLFRDLFSLLFIHFFNSPPRNAPLVQKQEKDAIDQEMNERDPF